LFVLLADQLGMGEALSYSLANRVTDAIGGGHGQAIIEAERLPINIAEQMEGLDANVCAVDATFQDRPEILAIISVNLPVNIGFRVVNNSVSIIVRKPVVRLQGITVKSRSGFYILAYQCLKRGLAARFYNLA